MTITQELTQIKDKLILADMEAETIADLLKDPTPENIKKASMKMEVLKEELEGCI